MNSIELNVLIIVLIVYAAWTFGFKRLLLERTRQAMFGVRHRLFLLGANGSIDFDDPIYRSVERFINANIRFSHKFNFMRFLLIRAAFGTEFAGAESFNKFHDEIKSHNNLRITEELLKIVSHVQLLAIRQLFWSFLPTAAAYAFAYIIFRSKSRMMEFAEKHLAGRADSIESVVLTADKALQA